MLNFTHVTLRRGARVLLEDLTLTIHAGQKIGITGANGAGKSSLFALVRHELAPDIGDFSRPPGLVIAHVAQETPASDTPAIEYVLDGDAELRGIERELAQAETDGDGARQARLHAQLDTIDAYTARSRAARLLHGLGFLPEQIEAPVRTFSGGWRMRLNLAQALMCRSDLLLLDEPTNHLDLDAVIWLEEWLGAYRGTLLLISHDRDFLDRVVNHIAHIADRRLRLYPGNYSAFERRRAEDLAHEQKAYDRQQREIAHIQSYVERFRAKASKARQAQSRLKALTRMETIAPAHVDSPFTFGFREPEKLPHPLLRIEGASVGYREALLLTGITLSIAPGDRIGLLGPNGAGKSTLIKMLAGVLAPRDGKRESARDLRVGYFAQHQLEQLRADETPLAHLQRLDPQAPERDLRNFLGGFGFTGDAALAAVAPLSGGEKARLALALLVYQRPNLLLLDEPTNHLDLDMRHALTLALQDFAGAMVIVSHDRHLLRTTSESLLLVADGKVSPYDGDIDDYPAWLAARRAPAEPRADKTATHSAQARKDRRRDEADKRRRLQPLRAQIQQLEKTIATLETDKARLETTLADGRLYEDKDRLKAVLKEQGEVQQRLAHAETAWLAACEELEAAERLD
jgi:ATP-binding cassette subfamily F protein 3